MNPFSGRCYIRRFTLLRARPRGKSCCKLNSPATSKVGAGRATRALLHMVGELLGAVWFRLPTGGHKGRRHEEKVAPELAFAVKPGHRRRGIGAALLTQLVKANPQHSTISIRASTKNPAVRLYERFGFKIVRQSAESVTMRREA
ncbi:MAG: hypothetical protein DME66_00445 [Verrucomicrobia bacterium]|nr:MAG: hypothetical protein DME66_00445 [Verrucomicrobiota bacterium]